MATVFKYLIYLCFLAFIIGPLARIPLNLTHINLYFSDLVVMIFCLTWLFNLKSLFPYLKTDKIIRYVFLFTLVAFLSLVFSQLQLSVYERIVSFLYLLRFLAYFFIYISLKYLLDFGKINPSHITRLLTASGLIISLIGWLQYFLYPDLRNLYYLDWDPHYMRIFSTYFDPNFLGLMLLLSLITSFFQANKSSLVWITRLIIFATLMFTYSRSSYLSLVAVSLFYSLWKKSVFVVGVTLILLSAMVFMLPRPGGEGVKLERLFSLEQRIESWRLGGKIFMNYPLFGAGFNSLRYAKRQFGISTDDWLVSHSGSGIENSFLFVLATTGIAGFIFYIYLLAQLFKCGNLTARISLAGILSHSFFLNSFFFPWVMLWLWMMMGIDSKHKALNPK